MPLDPQAQVVLEQVASAGVPVLQDMPVAEARRMLAGFASLAGPGEPVDRVDDLAVPTPEGDVPVRLYRPAADVALPLLVWFHGGGWVLGDLETTDGTCRSLANAAGMAVLSVDYRLAPEHPYPAAPEDCYAAVRWAHEHAAELGADPGRLAIGGDSSGGNLAAVVALMARDRGGPPLRAQLLVYPVTDVTMESSSYQDNGDGYFLTAGDMKWFWGHYLGGGTDGRQEYLSPLHAPDLTSLPPALVITAEYDPLRDEGEAYAARLKECGGDARSSRYDGMIHGFFGMGQMFDAAKQAIAEAAAALREHCVLSR